MASENTTPLSAASIAVLQSLQDLCTHNGAVTRAASGAATTSAFHSSCVPPVSVVDYGSRLVRHGRFTETTILTAAALALRHQLTTAVKIVELSVHRLLAAAVVVAVKTTSDHFYSNDYYGTVTGVPADELQILEAKLLIDLGFSAWVREEELHALTTFAANSVPAVFMEGYAADRTALMAAAAPEETKRRGEGCEAALHLLISPATPFPVPRSPASTPTGFYVSIDTDATAVSLTAPTAPSTSKLLGGLVRVASTLCALSSSVTNRNTASPSTSYVAGDDHSDEASSASSAVGFHRECLPLVA